MKRLNRCALVPMLAVASLAVPSAAAGAPALMHGPARFDSIGHAIEKSGNWSGYADTGGTFTKVSASWKVPGPTCPVATHQYSSFWVGIDGYSSNSVEQLGTETDCVNKKPSYYAWYEMFPAGSVPLSTSTHPVHKGDTITASVSVSGTTFTLAMKDVTAGWSFKIKKTSATAQKSSAEWIAEAPSSGSGILPLADFGTVKFTATKTTRNGTAGNILTFTNHRIEMVTSTNVVKAKPTTATAAGFSDTWHHS